MALRKVRGMQPPRREDAAKKQCQDCLDRWGCHAGMGGAYPWDGGIQRVSGDRETRGTWSNGVAGPDTLTFSAFFAASASERLSKLTKPTGCGGRTGVISQVPGELREKPLTPGSGGIVA